MAFTLSKEETHIILTILRNGKMNPLQKTYNSTLVGKLIRKGLVEKIINKNDRRCFTFKLTKSGHELALMQYDIGTYNALK